MNQYPDIQGVREAVSLKGAITQVDQRLYGIDSKKQVGSLSALLDADLDSKADIRNSYVKLKIDDKKLDNVKTGTLVKFKNKSNQTTYGIVRRASNKDGSTTVEEVSQRDAESFLNEFPGLNYLVLSSNDYSQVESKSTLSVSQTTPLVTFIIAFKEYILALFELIFGKAQSETELLNKAMIYIFLIVILMLLASFSISVWIVSI